MHHDDRNIRKKDEGKEEDQCAYTQNVAHRDSGRPVVLHADFAVLVIQRVVGGHSQCFLNDL